MIPILYITFNRLEYTKKTLPILLNNSIGGEVYIFDNASTDGTTDYLLEYKNHPKVKKITLYDFNFGITKPMNDFIQIHRDKKWCAKVDNDTLVPYNWLNKIVNASESAGFDIVQAYHYFGCKPDDVFDLDRSRFNTGDGEIIEFRHVGGSGVIFRADKIESEIIESDKLYGWGKFQAENPKLKRGFYSGVYVDVLDKEYINKHRENLDQSYYEITGRKLQGLNLD